MAAAVPLVDQSCWPKRPLVQQNRPPRISSSSVEQSVTRALAGRGLTVASVSFEVGTVQGSTAPVRATFKARLDQPLFTLVESQPYLQQTFHLESRRSARNLPVEQRQGRAAHVGTGRVDWRVL